MASNLVIVESPAKAKTIQKYLGNDFSVMSSYGHIRDLCDKGMAIDIENNFTPEYCVSKDKASLVKSEALLQQGESVFIWPEKFGKRFKDFNDIAIACKVDEISHDFCQKNTFKGLEGIVKLTEIKKYQSIRA